MPMPPRSTAGRAFWVGAAYAALISLAAIDYAVVDIHVGAVAIVALLVIAAFAGRYVAIGTAIVCAVAFGAFGHDGLPAAASNRTGIVIDALVLGLSYVAVIELCERMKKALAEKIAVEDDLRAARTRAERDSLTGLPNRGVFMNRLQFLAGHSTTNFAVLFGDLDRFKEVNDTHGHTVGDRILHLAGQRISHALRANDFVGRIGGDEFAVLLYGIHERAEADAIVAKIEASFLAPFVEADTLVSIGITLGASYFPDDAKSAEALLKLADERMYARKPGRRSSTGVIPSALRRRLTEAKRGDQGP